MSSNIDLKQGDCLELMKTIPDKSIDMILCDPPFAITNCKWDKMLNIDKLWEQYKRIIKDNGAIVLFAVPPFSEKVISFNSKMFKYKWYWKKNNITGGIYSKVQPMRCIEEVLVFYSKHPTYNPQGLVKLTKPIKEKKKSSELYKTNITPKLQWYVNYPNNFLEFSNEASSNINRLHPTQKPLKLMEYLIKTYTNEKEVVLDNCIGSGTVGVACVNTNRNFIGYELDEIYFNRAKKRIEDALNEKQNIS